MEQKDRYTLRELYSELKIPIAELGRRAGVSEITVAKIRDGASARRSTINSLLEAFSNLYGVKLSIDNVSGIIIKDKLAKREDAKKQYTVAADNSAVVAASDEPTFDPTKKKVSQNRNIALSESMPADLPAGTVKLVDFVNQYGLSDSNMGRWIDTGLKGEKIETTKRIRATGRTQHFLTPAQQEKAVEILKRHGKLKENE